MRITYIHHSGFLTETDTATLLFDFVQGTLPSLPADRPLYVFVSHTHSDHYGKRIFTEVPAAARAAGVPSLTYVLSADIPAKDVPASLKENAVFLQPHEKWKDKTVSVETLVSNDTGVAFVIALSGEDGPSVPGGDHTLSAKQIYYAGDLNAWNWDGDEEDMELIRVYHRELKRIDATVFDVAFIPLDPRLGEDDTQGITDFFDVCGCNAHAVVPMHCWEQYEIMERAKKKLADRPYAADIATYQKPGDTILL